MISLVTSFTHEPNEPEAFEKFSSAIPKEVSMTRNENYRKLTLAIRYVSKITFRYVSNISYQNDNWQMILEYSDNNRSVIVETIQLIHASNY